MQIKRPGIHRWENVIIPRRVASHRNISRSTVVVKFHFHGNNAESYSRDAYLAGWLVGWLCLRVEFSFSQKNSVAVGVMQMERSEWDVRVRRTATWSLGKTEKFRAHKYIQCYGWDCDSVVLQMFLFYISLKQSLPNLNICWRLFQKTLSHNRIWLVWIYE